MTGYVCALKPLRLIRARNTQAAFSTIAKSAFRRVPRFVLPATIAMIITWALCEYGVFTVAHRIDVPWLRDASPTKSHSFSYAVDQLVWNFRSVWTTGQMDYDDHQWALLPLLKGSMMVYMTISIATLVRYRYRIMIYALLYCYFYQDCRPDTGAFPQSLTHLYYGGLLSIDTINRNVWSSVLLRNASLRFCPGPGGAGSTYRLSLPTKDSISSLNHHRLAFRFLPGRPC